MARPEYTGRLVASKTSPPPLWGFRWHVSERTTLISIPLWSLFLFQAISTSVAWRLDHVATRREKQGKCKACGYDLAGLSAAAPCPECGKAATSLRGMGVPGETV